MQTKTTPKDFFLHLGATIALYVSAIAFINLCFSVVNYYLPDQLAGYFSVSSVAWPISMLIVLIPVLYVIEWFIARDLNRMPEKRDIWIRRWRIYLTLFLSGATVIGDLIALINTYLNGEITSRFAYKVIIVLIVSGVIFAYYLLARALESVKGKTWRKILAWVGIIIAIAGIVGGFLIVGSPAKQRALRFDSQRVNDLSNIQYQIVNYWQQKGKLPTALTDLDDSISGFTVPTDPESHSSYEYSIPTTRSVSFEEFSGGKPVTAVPNSNSNNLVGMPQFQLCATFDLASRDTSGRGAYGGYGGMAYPTSYPSMGGGNDTWSHAAGHACFSRTIDSLRYPVNKSVPKPNLPI